MSPRKELKHFPNFLIIDVQDQKILSKLLDNGNNIILSGRAVRFLELAKGKVSNLLLCKECSEGIEYDKKINYYAMSVLLRDNKARIIVEADLKSIDKVINFLALLSSLAKGEERGESLETEVGSLHCFRKHILGAEESLDEIIEKAVSRGIDPTALIRVRANLFSIYMDLMKMIYRERDKKLKKEDKEKLLKEMLRRVRDSRKILANFVYNTIGLDQYFLEDERRAEKHLIHAEEHLVEELQSIRNFGECIVCEEDKKV